MVCSSLKNFYQNNNVKRKSLAVNIRVPLLSSLKTYSKIKQSSQEIVLSQKNYKIRESKLSNQLFLLIKKFNQLQNQIINTEYITNNNLNFSEKALVAKYLFANPFIISSFELRRPEDIF